MEDALIERARRGDRQAFAALYDRYVQRVYRYVYYRVKDADEAEDVTSDVFMRAMTAMPRYEPRAPFGGWLCRIAHNLVIDRARSKAVSTRVSLDDAARDGEIKDAVDPDDEAQLHERRDAVRAAIRTLPPDQQEAIVLRFVVGLSTDEAAGVMGRASSTVRGLQMRALRRLRERFAPEDLA